VPRKPRVDLPGTIHHVAIRGIEGRRLFPAEGDAIDILQRFGRWLRETGCECIAWSLNGNHAHFVLRRGERPLAELMARFTSAFAQHFNGRYGRAGHLFQSRYTSRLIRDEADLRWTVLYVLGNPVRHGISDPAGLDEYLWSGWSGVIGARPRFDFESFDTVLGLYGESIAEARRNLRDALELAVETRWAPPPDERLACIIADVCARHRIERSALVGGVCAARAAQLEVIRRAASELKTPWRVLREELLISHMHIARALRAPTRRVGP